MLNRHVYLYDLRIQPVEINPIDCATSRFWRAVVYLIFVFLKNEFGYAYTDGGKMIKKTGVYNRGIERSLKVLRCAILCSVTALPNEFSWRLLALKCNLLNVIASGINLMIGACTLFFDDERIFKSCLIVIITQRKGKIITIYEH